MRASSRAHAYAYTHARWTVAFTAFRGGGGAWLGPPVLLFRGHPVPPV